MPTTTPTAVPIASETDLNTAITDANGGTLVPTTGTLTASFTETAAPDAITAAAGNLIIDGAANTITGDGKDAALIVAANGHVTLEDIGITNPAASGTGLATAISIGAGGVVTFEDDGSGNSSPIASPITGAGSVHYGTAGDTDVPTVILKAVNTYTGATIIDAGPVELQGVASIAASSNVSLQGAGAYLDVSGVTTTASGTPTVMINELTGIAGTTVALGGNNLVINENVINASFSGVISGVQTGTTIAPVGAGITVNGPDTLTLKGVNTYNGATIINGDLALSGAGSIADSSNVSLQGAGATFDVSGVTAASGSGPATVSINELTGIAGTSVALGTNTLAVTEDVTNASFSGVISGVGGGLTVVAAAGEGTTDILTLNGVNTYTGATTVQKGAFLSIGANGSIADSSSIKLNGTLSFTAAESSTGAPVTETLTDLTGNANGVLNLGSNSLILDTSSATATETFNGVITGTGNVTVNGDVALGGHSTYTGQTIVHGDLTLTGANTIADSSNVSLQQAGATLTIDSNKAVGDVGNDGSTIHELTGIAGTSVVIADQELRVIEDVTNASYSGVISGEGGTLSLFGPDSLTLKGVNTYSGDTYIHGADFGEAATLILSGSGSIASSDFVQVNGTLDASAVTGGTFTLQSFAGEGDGSIVLGANTLVVTNPGEDTFGGVISGSGGFQVGLAGSSPSGYVTLGGANTFTGATTIYGNLEIDNANALADSSNVSLKGAGASLTVDMSSTINELTGIAGTIVELNGPAPGPEPEGPATPTTLTIHENVVNASFSGSFTGAGIVDLDGPDTLTLNGASTGFDGTFIVEQGASLAIGASGSLSAEAALEVDGVFSLAASSGRAITIGSLSDGPATENGEAELISGAMATGQVMLGSNTLVISGAGEVDGPVGGIFGGVISGSGNLTLNGGELLLSGANTYTGVTTIGEGAVLALTGSLATSNVVDNGEFSLGSGGSFAPVISGSGAVEVGPVFSLSGAGVTVTLTGPDTYTGATGVEAGSTLAIGAGGSIAGTSAVELGLPVEDIFGPPSAGSSVATFDISAAGATVVIGGLGTTGPGAGAVNLGANTLEITGAPEGVFSGSITGTGGLQIDAKGALILEAGSASSTYAYTGATNVLGALTLENVTLDSSNVSIRSGGSLFTDGSVVINELTGQTNTTVTIDGGSLSVTENVVAASYSGVIQDGEDAPGSFVLAGPDALTLLGANTYTGTTTIETGASLVVQGSGSISDSSSVVDNGTLRFAVGATAVTLNDVHGTGTLSLGQSMLTDTIVGTGTTATLSGLIQGVGSLTVAGVTGMGGSTSMNTATAASHLTLSGANTFSGGLTITGGLVELASASAAGTAAVHFADATGQTGALQIDNAALTGVGTGTEHFANTISGLSAVPAMGATGTGGDVIDLTGLTYEGTATATFSGTTLTVTEGNATVSLTLTGVPAGDTFAAYQDSHGGTFLVLEAGTPTSQATYDMTHFHP